MQEFEPLMKEGKLPEAEAAPDRAIERLRGKTLKGPPEGPRHPNNQAKTLLRDRAPAVRVRVPQTSARSGRARLGRSLALPIKSRIHKH